MTKQPRPKKLNSQTLELPTPCGRVYVTVADLDGKPFEVFARLGKSGGCASAVVNAITTTLSIALRSGTTPQDAIKGLVGISCHRPPVYDPESGRNILSCVDALALAIKGNLEQS